MLAKKTIVAAVFSMVVAVAMTALPTRALAHDWDDGGGYGQRWQSNPGWNRGWGDHDGWRNRGGDRDDWRGGPGWQGNGWGRGDRDGDQGGGWYSRSYGGGYGNAPYNRPLIPGTVDGMVNPRNPRLRWACDGGGHHCHWAPNPQALGGYNYNYGAYNNQGGYNPGYGQSPALGALGSLAGPLLGMPIR